MSFQQRSGFLNCKVTLRVCLNQLLYTVIFKVDTTNPPTDVQILLLNSAFLSRVLTNQSFTGPLPSSFGDAGAFQYLQLMYAHLLAAKPPG
jgi:hypothetical protein